MAGTSMEGSWRDQGLVQTVRNWLYPEVQLQLDILAYMYPVTTIATSDTVLLRVYALKTNDKKLVIESENNDDDESGMCTIPSSFIARSNGNSLMVCVKHIFPEDKWIPIHGLIGHIPYHIIQQGGLCARCELMFVLKDLKDTEQANKFEGAFDVKQDGNEQNTIRGMYFSDIIAKQNNAKARRVKQQEMIVQQEQLQDEAVGAAKCHSTTDVPEGERADVSEMERADVSEIEKSDVSGREGHQAYEASQNANIRRNRTQLMLVGHQRAGKTSLLKNLTGQMFDENEQSTEGVDATTLCEVPVGSGQTWQLLESAMKGEASTQMDVGGESKDLEIQYGGEASTQMDVGGESKDLEIQYGGEASTHMDVGVEPKDLAIQYGDSLPYESLVFGTEIGKGSHSTVYRATFKGGCTYKGHKEVALKNLHRQDKKEVEIMKSLNHKNIVKFLAYLEHDISHFIVMEKCEQSLHKYLQDPRKPLDPELRKRWTIEAAEGIQYLHENDVVHRDLRAKNCLLTVDKTAKISDFGISKIAVETEHTTYRYGVLTHMAPEIIDQKKFSKKSDIYSFGGLLWEIFTRKISKPAENRTDLGQYIDERDNIPDEMKRIMFNCWERERQKRQTIEVILRQLNGF